MAQELGLHWVDYIIMVIFLGISIGIGIFHSVTGGRQKTTSEFIMANRKLMVIPTILSMVMSYMSAVLMIGITGEVYLFGGCLFLWALPGDIIGSIFIVLVIIPWIYPLQLVSVFDYLQIRYQSRTVRYVGAGIGIVHAILYNGLAMFAPSIALESVTGLSVMISLPVLAFVGTLYTALGGMRAVIWTDVFQGTVMMAGVFAVLIKAAILTSGIGNAFTVAYDYGRMDLTQVTYDPRVRTSALSIGCGAMTMVIFMKGFCQASVQRYSATKSLMAARRTMVGNTFLSGIFFLSAGLIAVAVFAYYAIIRCDPMKSGKADSSNKIITSFVRDAFANNIGFSGLFIATLYSGALSSLSSNLSGSAANIWEDLIKPVLGHRIQESREVALNKVLVVVVGVLSLGVAYVCSALPATMTRLTHVFFGTCGGPMVGIFLLGGLFRFANHIGAITGVIASFLIVGWISIGSMTVPTYTGALPPAPIDGCDDHNATTIHNGTVYDYDTYPVNQVSGVIENLYQVSFLLYSIIGILITLIVGTIVSALTNEIWPEIRKNNSKIPGKYFINLKNAFKKDISQRDAGRELDGFAREQELNAVTSKHLLEKDEITI